MPDKKKDEEVPTPPRNAGLNMGGLPIPKDIWERMYGKTGK